MKKLKTTFLAIVMTISVTLNLFLTSTGIIPAKKKPETTTPTPPKTLEEVLTSYNEVTPKYNVDINAVTITEDNNPCNKEYKFTPTAKGIYNEATNLMNRIEENSTNYLINHPEFVSAFLGDISQLNSMEEQLRLDRITIESILKDAISDILLNCTNEDICSIENLKVVISYENNSISSDTFTRFFPNAHLLVIYPNNVRKTVSNKGTNQRKALKYSIQCALNEIRAANCECQNNTSNNNAFALLGNIAIKSELYNTGKSNTPINNPQAKCESMVLALGIFKQELTINDYYNLVFSGDINALYEFCSVDANDTSKENLNNALAAMTIGINNLTPNNTHIENIVGEGYKVDIYSIFLSNITVYTIQNPEFTLDENTIIFKAIETLITNDMDPTERDENSKKINLLRTEYINFLSSYYQEPYDEIEKKLYSEETTNTVLALIDACSKKISYENSDVNPKTIRRTISNFPLLTSIFSSFIPATEQPNIKLILEPSKDQKES